MPVRPIPNNPWEAAPVVDDEPWASAPEAPDTPPLLGGGGATIGPAAPEGFWSEAARRFREAVFGHPDREDAKATGVGMQPTTAELVKGGLMAAGVMAGGASMGALAANPVRAGLAMAAGYGGEKAGEHVGRVAESMGAPRGTATTTAVVGGLVGGARGAGMRLGRKAAEAGGREVMASGLARRVASREGAAVATDRAAAAVAGAEAQTARAQQTILDLSRRGQSGDEIAAALRREHGIPPDQAKKLVGDTLAERYLRVPEGMPRLPTGRAAPPAAAPEPAGGRLLAFPEQAPAPTAGQVQAQEIVERALTLRQKHGLSGAQIVASLRQMYGLKPSDAQKLVNEMLAGLGKGGTP